MTEEKRLNFLDTVDSIMFKSYKSYGVLSGALHTLEHIGNVNLLIGKNNSGKSSVLDIIEKCFNSDKRVFENGVQLYVSKTRTTWEQVKEVEEKRQREKRLYPILDHNLAHYANFCAANYVVSLRQPNNNCTSLFAPGFSGSEEWKTRFASLIIANLKRFTLLRLAADRDVVPEIESDQEELESNGNGATNLIRRLLLNSNRDPLLITKTLLSALNQIMGNDGEFSAIHVLQLDELKDNQHLWEIFLEEKSREGRFALSSCGSGLKTIILLLLNLLVVPALSKNKAFIFAFEELENNLHPAVQRRLFQYIYNFATETNSVIFITAHSNIAINAFYGKPQTSLYQIAQDETGSQIIPVKNGSSAYHILKDIGAQASDLLQANGIIWVEGPSDRIYIEHWLQIYQETENVQQRVREGFDYQYLYYGGRLLAHYSADLENTAQDLIEIFKINANAVVVMDSDCIEGTKKDINDTKKRIRDELQSSSTSYCWITSTKEIENFVAPELWQEEFNTKIVLGPKESFNKYYQKVNLKPKKAQPPKVELAHKMVKKITCQNWNQRGLKNIIADIYRHICIWNA